MRGRLSSHRVAAFPSLGVALGGAEARLPGSVGCWLGCLWMRVSKSGLFWMRVSKSGRRGEARFSMRAASRRLLATTKPLPLRNQSFKQHLHKLNQTDPTLWTDRTLARTFHLPLENVQALLALVNLETQGQEIDPQFLELQNDIDHLLDEADVEKQKQDQKNCKAAAHAVEAVQLPDPRLDRMTPQQEDELARVFIDTFGQQSTHDTMFSSVQALVRSLSEEERRALEVAVGGPSVRPTEKNPVNEQEVNLTHVKSDEDTVESLIEMMDGSLDGLLAILRSRPEASTERRAIELHNFTLTQRTLPDKPGNREILRGDVTSANPRGFPRYILRDDFGRDPKQYIKTLGHERQEMRTVDSEDLLKANLKKRHENLTVSKQGLRRNKRQYVITEITNGKGRRGAEDKREPTAVRVHETGTGAREATDDEKKRALLRVQPPKLISRIRRNF